MSKRTQSILTTPQQVGIFHQSANFFDSIPTEGETQYNDYFAFMDEFLPTISEEVTQLCGGLTFIPYLDTKEWTTPDLAESSYYINVINANRLYFQDFLLELGEIIFFGTTLTEYDFNTTSGGYLLMPRRDFPYSHIDILLDGVSVTMTGTMQRITVQGFWGYHTDPAQLYVSTADTSVTVADTTTDEITVAAISAYETWQYIRIEDEIMLITARTSPSTLTVERGVNGTTAAIHTSQPITIIKPPRDIQSLAVYFAALAYENRNTLVADIELPDHYQKIVDRYQSIVEWQIAGKL
jgi:hypothetical protein